MIIVPRISSLSILLYYPVRQYFTVAFATGIILCRKSECQVSNYGIYVAKSTDTIKTSFLRLEPAKDAILPSFLQREPAKDEPCDPVSVR